MGLGFFCWDERVDGIGRVGRGNVDVGLVDGRCGFRDVGILAG